MFRQLAAGPAPSQHSPLDPALVTPSKEELKNWTLVYQQVYKNKKNGKLIVPQEDTVTRFKKRVEELRLLQGKVMGPKGISPEEACRILKQIKEHNLKDTISNLPDAERIPYETQAKAYINCSYLTGERNPQTGEPVDGFNRRSVQYFVKNKRNRGKFGPQDFDHWANMTPQEAILARLEYHKRPDNMSADDWRDWQSLHSKLFPEAFHSLQSDYTWMIMLQAAKISTEQVIDWNKAKQAGELVDIRCKVTKEVNEHYVAVDEALAKLHPDNVSGPEIARHNTFNVDLSALDTLSSSNHNQGAFPGSRGASGSLHSIRKRIFK